MYVSHTLGVLTYGNKMFSPPLTHTCAILLCDDLKMIVKSFYAFIIILVVTSAYKGMFIMVIKVSVGSYS